MIRTMFFLGYALIVASLAGNFLPQLFHIDEINKNFIFAMLYVGGAFILTVFVIVIIGDIERRNGDSRK
jgi:hypothetical protein